jgi:hypothetical protein
VRCLWCEEEEEVLPVEDEERGDHMPWFKLSIVISTLRLSYSPLKRRRKRLTNNNEAIKYSSYVAINERMICPNFDPIRLGKDILEGM